MSRLESPTERHEAKPAAECPPLATSDKRFRSLWDLRARASDDSHAAPVHAGTRRRGPGFTVRVTYLLRSFSWWKFIWRGWAEGVRIAVVPIFLFLGGNAPRIALAAVL